MKCWTGLMAGHKTVNRIAFSGEWLLGLLIFEDQFLFTQRSKISENPEFAEMFEFEYF